MNYKEMDITELVNIVNKELSNNKSLVVVAKELFNSTESALRKYINNRNYRRDKKTGLFVLTDEVKANTKPVKAKSEPIRLPNILESHLTTTDELTKEDIRTIKELTKNYKKIQQLLNNYNLNTEELKRNDNITIHKVINGQVRSWRVDEETIKRLNKYTKHSIYSTQDIVNSAIIHFLNMLENTQK